MLRNLLFPWALPAVAGAAVRVTAAPGRAEEPYWGPPELRMPAALQHPVYLSAAWTAKAVAELDPTARIAMRVPANSEVWFDGAKTASTGQFRTFRTPPLTPGKRYTYEVRARWGEKGREVTRTQKVSVSAGADVTIDFPAPDGAGDRAADARRR